MADGRAVYSFKRPKNQLSDKDRLFTTVHDSNNYALFIVSVSCWPRISFPKTKTVQKVIRRYC